MKKVKTFPLNRRFFERDPVTCARDMIGCRISISGCGGFIVETEAYAADGDPACHTWTRQKARDFVTVNSPGSTYVYLNYGIHWLLNFLVKGGASDGFVLIRALKPLDGIGLMMNRRNRRTVKDLCNGPGKLTQALGINGRYHGRNPFVKESTWSLLMPSFHPSVSDSTRVGISQATDRMWRFVLDDCPYVSVMA